MSEIIEDIKVERLPLKLRKNGFTYTQVCRGERSFVYEQTITPKIKYYEVSGYSRNGLMNWKNEKQ